MENSKIAWCHNTFNPWMGCERISSGCAYCYAEAWARRVGRGNLWNGERIPTGEAYWRKPVKWNLQAEKERKPKRVFCGSLCDVFEDHPSIETQRNRLFDLIENTQWLNWMLLTKRIDTAEEVLKIRFPERIPYNIWMGVTIEGDDPETAKHRADILRRIPAFIRFVSFEPLLGGAVPSLEQIHLAIVGGESGSTARRMNPNWARNVLEMAKKSHTSYFFKQAGTVLAREWGMKGKGDDINQLPHQQKDLNVQRIPYGYQRHIK